MGRGAEGTRDIESAILKHQSFFTNNSMVEPPSELILFSEQNTAPANYDAYKDVEVKTQNGEEKAFSDFSELEVAPALKRNVERCNYSHPTPVQRYTILHAQAGRDMQVQANTGSGKTAAFAIPGIDAVLRMRSGRMHSTSYGKEKPAWPAMLVVLPTRELAQQTVFNFYRLSHKTGLRCRVLYGGGENTREMKRALERGCDVLVGCPGKLIDFYEQGLYKLAECKLLVIDEADRCLDMGFEPQIRQLVTNQDLGEHQTLLFSATFSRTIQKLADDLLRDPVRIIAGTPRACASVAQELRRVRDGEKLNACRELLEGATGKAIVFCETKQRTADVALALRAAGVPTEVLHGDLDQSERTRAMTRFRGDSRVLVATDCAQRGLDVPNVTLVVNYDCPRQVEDYIHRVGRTGRVGQEGRAVTFVSGTEGAVIGDIAREVEAAGNEVPEEVRGLRWSGMGSGNRGGKKRGSGNGGMGGSSSRWARGSLMRQGSGAERSREATSMYQRHS